MTAQSTGTLDSNQI